MGKAIRGVPEAPALRRADPGEEAGIGAYLAQQRRLRGISLDELAALTRIPRRSLERLESGVFDGPPDGFVRGFVRTVATAIGLDPEEAVSRMLREPEARRRPGLPSLGRLAVLGAALLAVLAVGVVAARVARRAGTPRVEQAPVPRAAPLPVRRDHVRALAVEEGLLGPESAAARPE